jgi:hypothetical protein
MRKKLWSENLKGRDLLEDVGVYCRMLKKDLKELGYYNVGRIHLAQDRAQWLAVVNTEMIIRVP